MVLGSEQTGSCLQLFEIGAYLLVLADATNFLL